MQYILEGITTAKKQITTELDRYLKQVLQKQMNTNEKANFLYPRSRYYGSVNPENLVFNANLQEFTQRINFICALETSGKLTPEEAYKQISALWKQLKRSKKELGIGQHPFRSDDNNNEGNQSSEDH